jgi:TrmH family RNA methyltransferase
LAPDSVEPFNGKVVRASMGAIFHVPVEVDVPFESLRERFPRIASLDLRGEAITSAGFADFDCYLFGNEARGLPREAAQQSGARAFTIAGTGAIESLNVAASVNMALYEIHRR